jgi:hypothetical protein
VPQQPVPLVDLPLPQNMIWAFGYPENTDSHIFRALDYGLDYPEQAVDALYLLDDIGRVTPVQIPPTRTGTNRADFGIPQKLFEYGAQTPLSTGLGYTVSSYCWSAWQLRGESVMTEPSRDPGLAMRAVAPKQAGARPGIVIVINEWWKDSPGDELICRKALTGYVIGVGGVVLAKSSAADHSCLIGFITKSESQQINELLTSLLNTPTMSAALKGQIVAPPPPPPSSAPAPAPSSCSEAQVAKLKSYGISDDDIRRTCAGTK